MNELVIERNLSFIIYLSTVNDVGASAQVKKRKRPVSEEDVVEWFQNLRKEGALAGYESEDWDVLIANVSKNKINGDNLLSFERDDLQLLGVNLVGPQRTLLDKMKELKRIDDSKG